MRALFRQCVLEHVRPRAACTHSVVENQHNTQHLHIREGCLHWWRVLPENFKLNSGSMSKDMRFLMRKDLQQLSCFDSCWGWSVFAESAVVLVSRNLPKLSYKQLCRDMELTLMNESAKHVCSLIELHEHLNSSHFPGSFGTIESPTLVSAILNDGVVGCGGGQWRS